MKRLFVWSAILSLFVDQVAKTLAYGMLDMHVPVNVIGEFVRFARTSNVRGLFGMSYGPQWIYFVLPVAGMALVVWFALRSPDRWHSVTYGIILGGALGNLIDRIRVGHVIDFIDIGIGPARWYTFNPADMFIICGVVMLLAREFLWRKKPADPAPAAPEVAAGTDAPNLPR